MSEIETHPAAEKPFCDPGKETQTPVINDKSDLAKHIDANRGSSNKNQTISRPNRNELSQFSESNKTKHKINSHKLSVVKPKAQVKKVKKKRFFLNFPARLSSAPVRPSQSRSGSRLSPTQTPRPPRTPRRSEASHWSGGRILSPHWLTRLTSCWALRLATPAPAGARWPS